MKSLKFTATAAEINAGTEKKIDVRLLNSENNVNMVPNSVFFQDLSGCVTGVLFIDNDTEDAKRLVTPTEYEFIPVSILSQPAFRIPSSVKFIAVKKISGTATGDLNIFCHNYLERQ